MSIHVARHSSQLGVFTAEEITAGLQSGRFLASDLAWREGMVSWTPLGEWPEFRGAVPPAMPGAPAAAPAGPMPAWERGGSFGSFFETMRDVALDPIGTFDALPSDGGYGKPIRYAYANLLPVWLLLTLVFGLVSLFMWASIQQGLLQDPDMPDFLLHASPALFFFGLSAIFTFIFLLAPWFHFLNAGLMHVLLLPWGPKGGYAQTYRASSYVTSAFTLPGVIPCVNYVAAVWQLVCHVIAQSRVHKIAWWKVCISFVVIPTCCLCLFYSLFIAALAARLH